MVVDDMIPSEADQPTHGQQQAVLGASVISVIALPWVAPKVGASEAVALTKADRLVVRSLPQNCFKQVWPDFATACLRTSGSEAKIIEARLVIAGR